MLQPLFDLVALQQILSTTYQQYVGGLNVVASERGENLALAAACVQTSIAALDAESE